MFRKEIIVTSPDAAVDRAVRPLLETLAREGVPSTAERIYHGSRNSIYTLPIPSLGTVSIKEFKIPVFPNNFVYCGLRGSKARRSFEHAMILADSGIQTPAPYGYVEVRSGVPVRLGRSYYVCRHVPYHPIREWESGRAEDVPLIAAEIGRCVAQMHKAGIYHRDFSRGNLLLVTGADGRPCGISLLDLNRMNFHVRDTSMLMRMFGGLAWTEESMRMIVDAYCGAFGMDSASVLPRALAEQRRFIRAFKRKHHLK